MSRPRPAWAPPMRDGVSASRVNTGARPPASLLDFLAQRLPALPRSSWQQRLEAGEVLDAQGQVLAPDAACRPHETLWYWRRAERPEPPVRGRPEILHLDEHLLVVDKPHGWPMTPKGAWVQNCLQVHLKCETGLPHLSPIHRLDRETAGVVAFAVRPEDRGAYQGLFRDGRVRKVYEAVSPWRAGDDVAPRRLATRLEPHPEAFMQMRTACGNPNAVTHIEAVTPLGAGRGPEAEDGIALYRLRPETGRKHQLRAQMHALERPILGDRIYPVLQPAEHDLDAEASLPLQLLARELSFTDPIDGRPRRFVSRRVLQRAGPPPMGGPQPEAEVVGAA